MGALLELICAIKLSEIEEWGYISDELRRKNPRKREREIERERVQIKQ